MVIFHKSAAEASDRRSAAVLLEQDGARKLLTLFGIMFWGSMMIVRAKAKLGAHIFSGGTSSVNKFGHGCKIVAIV